uniref:Si:ch211-196f5.2 n=1 Tax=Scophthalmus maximus TaxID=52904 RepID=A0A8D3C0D8_SCOMX
MITPYILWHLVVTERPALRLQMQPDNRDPDLSQHTEMISLLMLLVQFPGPSGRMVRVELEWDVPMSVTLPIQVQPDAAHQPFPFLDTTLADLGIKESEVKERVVWVDTKKTQVKNKAGKVKEKEITILEVRVKAQKPGDKELQEVLYSTEAHTDRSFCRTGMNILPWKQRCKQVTRGQV